MNACFSESRSLEVTPMTILCTPIARSSLVAYHIVVNNCEIDKYFLIFIMQKHKGYLIPIFDNGFLILKGNTKYRFFLMRKLKLKKIPEVHP